MEQSRQMKKEIILASASPRRREILERMGLDFEIIPSDYDEVFENFDFSYEKIENLAYNKANAVFEVLKDSSSFCFSSSLILAADTVVVLDNEILCKPKDEGEAISILKKLSGKQHFVVTSICIINTETADKKVISETSYVEFKVLSEDLIKDYVKNYKPLDKAGAYGIQELPDGFVNEIRGSFENIIGLCSKSVKKLLEQ